MKLVEMSAITLLSSYGFCRQKAFHGCKNTTFGNLNISLPELFVKSAAGNNFYCGMKIYSAPQIRKADNFTMLGHGLPSDVLMENAARALFAWIAERFRGENVRFHLFCGVGNNGGDALALARMLQGDNYDIRVYVVDFGGMRSGDFLLNLQRLEGERPRPEFLDQDSDLPELGPGDIVVDGIYGIGLNRAPAPWVGRLIEHINNSPALVLAVDVPSGLPMDRAPWNPDHVVRADVSLCFQWPKLIYFLPDTGRYSKALEVLDIGLDLQFEQEEESEYELVEREGAAALHMPRERFAHKGDFGHALIVGGSHGKIGAVQLAASACLSMGSGMVTVHLPECGYHALQTALPEAMVLTDRDPRTITHIELPFEPAAIGIGVGMGTAGPTVQAFGSLLRQYGRPMVIDADGINILAFHRELLDELPRNSILTPHPRELERLIGPWRDDFEKLEKAKAFVREHQVVLVIKGANTMVLTAAGGFVNTSGNPGMATAGSGDVLTGLLTALLAQGYPADRAAVFGVYVHGLAGDLCAGENFYEGVRATGIIAWIGRALAQLLGEGTRKTGGGPKTRDQGPV